MHVEIELEGPIVNQIAIRWESDREYYDHNRTMLPVVDCARGLPYWMVRESIAHSSYAAVARCGYHELLDNGHSWYAWLRCSGSWAWLRQRNKYDALLVLSGPRHSVLELVDRDALAAYAVRWTYHATREPEWRPWQTLDSRIGVLS